MKETSTNYVRATNGPAGTMIPLSSIIVSQLPPQVERRKHFKPEGLQELAASIMEQGLIQPIVVRPVRLGNEEGVDYEIVAGERRYLAHTLNKGHAIDCIIRDLDDEQTIEVQLQENLQRMQAEPLDEAFAYKWLIENVTIGFNGTRRPYTIADIAARFAKTEEIIARRLKLNDLCEAGKKDLAEGSLPLAHAELVARFPIEMQERLLKTAVYRWNEKDKGAQPMKDVRSSIERNHVLSLTGAKFDTADATLRKDGLICADCTKRTGHSPLLFTDTNLSKKDHCLDRSCWSGKLKTMLQQKREKIAEALPNPKKLSLKELALQVPLIKYDGYGETNNVSIGKGIYVENSWYSKAKFTDIKQDKSKQCEFAEKGLRVGGNGIGASVVICRSTKCALHKAKNKPYSAGSSLVNHNSADEQLKRKERDLNVEIVEKTRIPILKQHINSFNAEKTVFSSPDLRRRLLAAMIVGFGYDFEDRYDEFAKDYLPKDVLKLVNSHLGDDEEKVLAAIETLTEDQESKIFAMVTFGWLGYSDHEEVDQSRVIAIAGELGVDYELRSAQTRMQLVPKEHKAAAQAHLDKIIAGEKADPPTVFWPKPQPLETKKASTKKAKAAKGGN